MLETSDYMNAVLEALDILYMSIEPYVVSFVSAMVLGAIGIAIIKSIVGNVVDFFTLGYSASETRKIKKSAFKFVDFISALSDVLSAKK